MRDVLLAIIPVVLTTLTPFAIQWIRVKVADTRLANAFVLVTNAVIATTQTYVDTARKQGKWDAEAKQIAFLRSKETAIALLGPELRKAITKTYGDLDAWLEVAIESAVKQTK